MKMISERLHISAYIQEGSCWTGTGWCRIDGVCARPLHCSLFSSLSLFIFSRHQRAALSSDDLWVEGQLVLGHLHEHRPAVHLDLGLYV